MYSDSCPHVLGSQYTVFACLEIHAIHDVGGIVPHQYLVISHLITNAFSLTFWTRQTLLLLWKVHTTWFIVTSIDTGILHHHPRIHILVLLGLKKCVRYVRIPQRLCSCLHLLQRGLSDSLASQPGLPCSLRVSMPWYVCHLPRVSCQKWTQKCYA